MSEEPVEKIRMRTNLGSLMLTAAKEHGSIPLAIGFGIAEASLVNLAQRALQIKDPVILSELYHLGYLEKYDGEEAGYRPVASRWPLVPMDPNEYEGSVRG